jgi:hypothetical protein
LTGISVERRDDWLLEDSTIGVVALVRLIEEFGRFTTVTDRFAWLTSSSAIFGARVRIDLVAGRVLVYRFAGAGAAASSGGARIVGWRRDSCTFGLGGDGIGIGTSSWKGFPIPAGLLQDGQPPVQLGLVQLTQLLQVRGPHGRMQSSALPILRTVFGMMHSNCRPQQGVQHELPQGEPQDGAREVQLLQPQPSLCPAGW